MFSRTPLSTCRVSLDWIWEERRLWQPLNYCDETRLRLPRTPNTPLPLRFSVLFLFLLFLFWLEVSKILTLHFLSFIVHCPLESARSYKAYVLVSTIVNNTEKHHVLGSYEVRLVQDVMVSRNPATRIQRPTIINLCTSHSKELLLTLFIAQNRASWKRKLDIRHDVPSFTILETWNPLLLLNLEQQISRIHRHSGQRV